MHPWSLVIHCKPQGTAPALFCYHHVNLESKHASAPVALKAPLEDISKSCRYGIDARLDIYDLVRGQPVATVPYANRGPRMRLHVRFTDTCSHVLFIDKVNDTLHVVRLEEDGRFSHIGSCFTHAPKMKFYEGLTLRQKGQVIVITSAAEEGVIIVRLLDSEVKIQYGSETERALSLVPESKCQHHADTCVVLTTCWFCRFIVCESPSGPGLDALLAQKQENALKRALLNERNLDADNPLETMPDDLFLQKFRFTKDGVLHIIQASGICRTVPKKFNWLV